MMRLIVLPMLILAVSGCSVARDAVGFVSNIGGKTESITNAEANAVNTEASITARGITRADDIGQLAKQVPGGLIGDSKNSLHSGDPINPQ